MRVHIKRICVPTDFSDMADHAVHYAAAMAHQHGASLHLLHVLEHADALVNHPDFSGHGEVAREYFARLEQAEPQLSGNGEPDLVITADGTSHVMAETASEAQSADATEKAHAFLKALEEGATEQISNVGAPWWENLEVMRVVRYGHPVEEICQYANKNGIDLIVMGTHGRSGLSKLMMGSVTERTLRISPCPVLVLRHPDHAYTVVD